MAKQISRLCAIATAMALSVVVFQANAESGGGSGEPQIQLQVTPDQRIILSLIEGPTLAIGSAKLEQAYAELPLDAFSATSSQTNWGKAEILLDCDVADVLIYQLVEGGWQERMAAQVSLGECVE